MEKFRATPTPWPGWASQREALDLSAVTDVGQTPWGSLLLEEAGQTAAYWADQMARACDLAQKEAGLEKAYGDSLQATRRSLEAFVQAAGTSWDEAARVEIVFPKLKAARGVEDPALQEQIKSIRARAKGGGGADPNRVRPQCPPAGGYGAGLPRHAGAAGPGGGLLPGL